MWETQDARQTEVDGCVWCKQNGDHALETDETICIECLELCRRWGRDIYILLRPSGGLDHFILFTFHNDLRRLYQQAAERLSYWEHKTAAQTPVLSNHCVFCNLPNREWDDSVTAHAIDTGETLCRTCLRNMRQFRRSLLVHIIGHRDLPEPAKVDLADLVENISTVLETMYPADEEIHRHGFYNPTNATVAR